MKKEINQCDICNHNTVLGKTCSFDMYCMSGLCNEFVKRKRIDFNLGECIQRIKPEDISPYSLEG